MSINIATKPTARRFRSHVVDALVHSLPIWVFRRMMEYKFINFGLETTNICNANCTFCGYRFMKRPKKIMPWEVFEKAVAEFSRSGGGTINFTPTVGDPLVDKKLVEKIRYARKFKNILGVFLYTNGLLLSRFDLKTLLSSGLTRLAISTFIGSREGYKKYYGKDKYDQIISELLGVAKMNQELGRPVMITLHLRVEGDKNKWMSSLEYKEIAPLIGEQNISWLNEYDHWGGLIRKEDIPEGTNICVPITIKKKIESPCFELYRRVHILADGNVGSCVCVDLESDIKIGNLKESTLEQIWHGEPLKQYRKDWIKGNLPKPCINCTRYEGVNQFIKKYRKRVFVDFLKRTIPRVTRVLTR